MINQIKRLFKMEEKKATLLLPFSCPKYSSIGCISAVRQD